MLCGIDGSHEADTCILQPQSRTPQNRLDFWRNTNHYREYTRMACDFHCHSVVIRITCNFPLPRVTMSLAWKQNLENFARRSQGDFNWQTVNIGHTILPRHLDIFDLYKDLNNHIDTIKSTVCRPYLPRQESHDRLHQDSECLQQRI